MTAHVFAPPHGQWRRAALFAGVLAAHGIGLWLTVHGIGRPPETLPEPLPITVDLLVQQATQPPRPVPVPPEPHPPVTPAPHTAQRTPAPAKPVAAPVPAAQPVQATPAAAVSSQPAAHPAPPAPSAPATDSTSEHHANTPATPAPITPIRFDAAYLNNPNPVYPPLSRRLGEQGKVFLRVRVTPDGLPDEIELKSSSGSARLDKAALETVRKWRFVPARQGDKPVTEWVVVPIVFKLEE